MTDWFVPGYGNFNETGITTDYFMPGYGNLNEVAAAPPAGSWFLLGARNELQGIRGING